MLADAAWGCPIAHRLCPSPAAARLPALPGVIVKGVCSVKVAHALLAPGSCGWAAIPSRAAQDLISVAIKQAQGKGSCLLVKG